MRNFLWALFLPLCTFAAHQDIQEVSFSKGIINEIFIIQGGTINLIGTENIAGGDTVQAVNSQLVLGVHSDQNDKAVTAHCTAPLPRGIKLSAKSSNNPGVSQGAVSISQSPEVVFSDFENVNDSDISITYTLDATLDASPFEAVYTVVYTLVTL